jgi:hypothetical protein
MLSFDQNRSVALEALRQSKKYEATVAIPLRKFVSDFTKVYVKAKTTSLADLRALGSAIGVDTLKSLADLLTVAEATSLLKRLDVANAVKAKEEPTWMRGRLAALLAGDVEPDPVVQVVKEKVVKEKAPPKPKGPAKAKRSVMDETDAFSAKRIVPNSGE